MTEINDQHIILYLENRLTEEEKKSFEQKMHDSGEFRKEVDEIRFVWGLSEKLKLQQRVNTEGHWRSLSQKIAFDRYKRQAIRLFRSSAAILLLPLLTATIFLYTKPEGQPDIEQIELTSAYGIVSKVILPDGSEVWLNSGSRLSYPSKFAHDKRRVQLSGEAYFKVTADNEHRFDVITPEQITISAYGTEFNVKAYPEENQTETTLAEGHVELMKDQSSSLGHLNPGEYLTYDKKKKQATVGTGNLISKTGWKEGKMVFRRASMEEITNRLARHFNVDIRLEGIELQDYEYSATFTTESLEDILRLLEKTAPISCNIIYPTQTKDFSYTRRTVIIRSL